MNDWEQDLLELRLAEQEIYKQALEARDARLAELQAEAQYLRRTLHELLAVPRTQAAAAGPRAAPAAAGGSLPRRWRAG